MQQDTDAAGRSGCRWLDRLQLLGDLGLVVSLRVECKNMLVNGHSTLLADLLVGFMPLKW